MKKSFTVCALAVAAIACQKQEAFTPSELVEASFSVGVPTKTIMDADGGMSWKDSDQLSVFTDTDASDQKTNYKFTVQSLSEDLHSAVFSADVVSNPQRTTVYAIYPYADSRSDNEITGKAVSLSYPINQTYLSTRLLMAGKGSVSGNDFSQVSLQMQQLTWVWDITIDNPAEKSIASVELKAAEQIFPYKGTLDLTSDQMAVDVTEYRSSLQYNFSAIQTGKSVLARFPVFPMEAHADMDLDVIVRFEDGAKEVFSRKAPAKATEAGKRYHNTYTLGQGVYDDMPDGYVLVKKGEDLRAKLNSQMNSESVTEVKLYLESSPTEVLSYSLGATRINPTKSVYIRSNPADVKPVISASAGCTFEITAANASISAVSLKNVEINHTGSGDFMQISNSGISLSKVEIDNCILRGYKKTMLHTKGTNSVVENTAVNIDEFIINNSIIRMPNFGKDPALFQLRSANDTPDCVKKIYITNSTLEGIMYLIYSKMTASAGKVDYKICNNTFVNTRGNDDGYFVCFANGVKGTIDISSNLFGGTCTATKHNLCKNNLVTLTYADNYATSDWKTFADGTKNGTDFIENVTGTNAEVFTDLANFDLTLKPGTAAYGANAGDPRWLPTSSAGLGDLEIEDTEY